MTDSLNAGTSPDFPLFVRLAPLITGVLAALVALVAATLLGMPLPFDIAGVFLVIGLATAWVARDAPTRGALFVALLAFVVLATVYGG